LFCFAQQNKAGGTAKNLSKFLSEGQIFLDRTLKVFMINFPEFMDELLKDIPIRGQFEELHLRTL